MTQQNMAQSMADTSSMTSERVKRVQSIQLGKVQHSVGYSHDNLSHSWKQVTWHVRGCYWSRRSHGI